MRTIVHRKGADILSSEYIAKHQCKPTEDDQHCGQIYINKFSKALKYYCFYCSYTYDDIMIFCQHIIAHMDDIEQAMDCMPFRVVDDIKSIDESKLEEDSVISNDAIESKNGFFRDVYNKDFSDEDGQFSDYFDESVKDEMFNELDEWEQITAEAEVEMQMNSEVFEEYEYFKKSQKRFRSSSIENTNETEEDSTELLKEVSHGNEKTKTNSGLPVCKPPKSKFLEDSLQNSNIAIKLSPISDRLMNASNDITNSVKTFKQQIIGETVITLIPPGMEPPKRINKAETKTARIEIHSNYPISNPEPVEGIPTVNYIALEMEAETCRSSSSSSLYSESTSSVSVAPPNGKTSSPIESITIISSSNSHLGIPKNENASLAATATTNRPTTQISSSGPFEMPPQTPFVVSFQRSLADVNSKICPACGRKFRNASSLAIHKRSHYLDSRNNIKLAHKCPECEGLFNTLTILREHIKTFHFPQGFICKICGAKLISFTMLETHMKRKHLINPYKCIHCGESFNDRVSYEDHANVIDGCGYNYQCKVCAKGFIVERSLQIHMGSHRKEKPTRSCTICGTSTIHLEKHMKIHTPRTNRLFKCTICSKTFKFSSNLSAHMKHVHKKVRSKNYFKNRKNPFKQSETTCTGEIKEAIEIDNSYELHVLQMQMDDAQVTEQVLTEILEYDTLTGDQDFYNCSNADFKSPMINC